MNTLKTLSLILVSTVGIAEDRQQSALADVYHNDGF
jgi:hypothetical protein